MIKTKHALLLLLHLVFLLSIICVALSFDNKMKNYNENGIRLQQAIDSLTICFKYEESVSDSLEQIILNNKENVKYITKVYEKKMDIVNDFNVNEDIDFFTNELSKNDTLFTRYVDCY